MIQMAIKCVTSFKCRNNKSEWIGDACKRMHKLVFCCRLCGCVIGLLVKVLVGRSFPSNGKALNLYAKNSQISNIHSNYNEMVMKPFQDNTFMPSLKH